MKSESVLQLSAAISSLTLIDHNWASLRASSTSIHATRFAHYAPQQPTCFQKYSTIKPDDHNGETFTKNLEKETSGTSSFDSSKLINFTRPSCDDGGGGGRSLNSKNTVKQRWAFQTSALLASQFMAAIRHLGCFTFASLGCCCCCCTHRLTYSIASFTFHSARAPTSPGYTRVVKYCFRIDASLRERTYPARM